jgi:hypothetical protein
MAEWYDWCATASTVALSVATILVVVTAAFVANVKISKQLKIGLLIIDSFVVALSITFALIDFNAKAELHSEVAAAWQNLAADWDKARDARDTATPEELRKMYDSLLAKEMHIEQEIEPDGYSRRFLKKSQDDYNRQLGIDS